ADIFLVARHDMVGAAGAPAVVKGGFGDAARRDGDLLAMLDIGDLALAQGVLHRALHLGPGALQEPLPVAEALALRVLAAIDDVHQRILARRSAPSRPCSPACTTRRGGAPGAQCSRATPSVPGSPRASFRSRCPSCCRS